MSKIFPVIFLGFFITTSASADVLETNLKIKSGNTTAKISGYGLMNAYEFTSTSTLRLISSYASSATGVKTVVCEIRNIFMLSPIYKDLLRETLSHANSPTSYAYTTIQCLQNIENREEIQVPKDLMTVTVVVDLLLNPDSLKLGFKNNNALINGGYTSITTQFEAN